MAIVTRRGRNKQVWEGMLCLVMFIAERLSKDLLPGSLERVSGLVSHVVVLDSKRPFLHPLHPWVS